MHKVARVDTITSAIDDSKVARSYPMPRMTRFHVLLALLFGSTAAWLLLVGLERYAYRDEENHSLIEKKDQPAHEAPDEHEQENYSLIEKSLYMGGLVTKPPPGTAAVLNLCEHADSYACEVLLWKPIPDEAPAPSLDWLRHAVDFVDQQHEAQRITYVHCAAGVSRSGMVVIAYLMRRNRWPRDQALEFVRSRRPQTRPNPAFMKLLLEWEHEALR